MATVTAHLEVHCPEESEAVAQVLMRETVPSTPSGGVELLGAVDWTVIKENLDAIVNDAVTRIMEQLDNLSAYNDARRGDERRAALSTRPEPADGAGNGAH